jgi:UDP-N-acetylglucosamine:LPS N-acetylglucosamine transferase
MKTVILTSGLGYGHTRAGEAIATALRGLGAGEVETIDFWSLMSPEVSSGVKKAYLELVSTAPGAYEELYQLTEKDWQEHFRSGRLPPPLDRMAAEAVKARFPEADSRLPIRRGVSLDETLVVAMLRRFQSPKRSGTGRLLGWGIALGIRSLLMARLLNKLQALAPDAVVATQMLPATLLSYIRDNGEMVETPSFGVLTDYGVHDFWARSGLDFLCVAHQDLAVELERKRTSSRVVVTGMPLIAEFAQPPSPTEGRLALGLAADRPTILVTGGAYAIGVEQTLAGLLAADPSWQIVATTGRQAGGRGVGELVVATDDGLRRVDWIGEMASLVSTADIVAGKPGGLTMSEAMACGRPFVATCSLAGQEGYNVRFLERHGFGVQVAPESLIVTLREVLSDPDRLARMGAAARHQGVRDGAKRIAALIGERAGEAERVARWAVP